jgi:ATP-dependent helicase/nuclease subunit A
VWEDSELAAFQGTTAATGPASDLGSDAAAWKSIQQRLEWAYPHLAATTQPAKTSVSVLRRRAAETDEESQPIAFVKFPRAERTAGTKEGPKRTASAVEVGNAHHHFLQLMNLQVAKAANPDGLRQEAERLRQAGGLEEKEFALLDFKELAVFWQSAIGRQIGEHAEEVKRELAFTARFSAADLERLAGESATQGALGSEFIVVQGAVDLAVIMAREIWVLDFKTDDVAAGEAAGRAQAYGPQLRLYAHALSRIYTRPVTRADLWFLAPGKSISVELQAIGSQ